MQRVICARINRLKKFSLPGGNGDMAEPTVFFSTVPVFYICRDFYDIACFQILCGPAVFLIPPFAVNADEQLTAAACRPVDMPIIAAGRFERDIMEGKRSVCRG